MLTKYFSIVPIIIGIAIGIAIGSAGTVAITKATREDIPPCPQIPPCPPATEVRMQTIDMEALKKIRGSFNYSPTLSNVTVKLESSDSALIKLLLQCQGKK